MPPRPFRRLLARWFDTYLAYSLVSFLLALRLGYRIRSIGDGTFVSNTAMWLPAMLLCMLAESVLLSRSRRTPGKWMWGLRVEPADGNRVSFACALNRTFTAISFGLGAMIPLVYYYAGVQSYRDLTERGTTSWDRGRFVVSSEPLRVWRIIVAAAALLAVLIVSILPAVL